MRKNRFEIMFGKCFFVFVFKNLLLRIVEGHLWKAQWKEKSNDEGHSKLTMNS